MPREDVDHPALAEDREGHLGRRDPLRQIAERAGDRLVQPRMLGVEQAIEVAGPPAPDDVDANVQRGGDSAKPIEGKGSDVTSLQARDRRLADTRPPGKVDLAPPASDPDAANGTPEALVAHGRECDSSLFAVAYPARYPPVDS